MYAYDAKLRSAERGTLEATCFGPFIDVPPSPRTTNNLSAAEPKQSINGKINKYFGIRSIRRLIRIGYPISRKMNAFIPYLYIALAVLPGLALHAFLTREKKDKPLFKASAVVSLILVSLTHCLEFAIEHDHSSGLDWTVECYPDGNRSVLGQYGSTETQTIGWQPEGRLEAI